MRGDNLSGDVTVRRGKRSVTLGGGATPPFCAVPKITGVTPTGGNVGVEIKITGSNFDPNATVQLGGGAVQPLGVRGAGTAHVWVNYGDTSGAITVNNQCTNTTVIASTTFRKINVTVNKLQLNQGYIGMGYYSGNSTLASAWISVDQAPRATDVIKIDYAHLQLGPPGNVIKEVVQPIGSPGAYSVGAPNPAMFADIANAINMSNILYYGSGPTNVHYELTTAGRVVASSDQSITFEPTTSPRVLLIPIMPDGYSAQQLNQMKSTVDANLADYRYRIYPGGLEPYWSDEVIAQSQVTSNPLINIGDGGEQAAAGSYFEGIRQRYNATHYPKAPLSFGVVFTSVVTGTAAGLGVLGTTSQWQAHTDCEDSFLSDVKDFFGFDSGCGPEFPQYLGWAQGDANASRYFAHELSHMLGLVPNNAANVYQLRHVDGRRQPFGRERIDHDDGGRAGDAGRLRRCGCDVQRSAFVLSAARYQRAGGQSDQRRADQESTQRQRSHHRPRQSVVELCVCTHGHQHLPRTARFQLLARCALCVAATGV